MAIPAAFTEHGLLPLGTHEATFAELRASLLIRGPGNSAPHWDSAWRSRLVDNAEVLVNQLWQVGISAVYLNGSFAEDKERPNDIDGYFEVDPLRVGSGDLERELNAIDPHKVWTWDPDSRRPYRGSTKKQLPMWHQYRVELYPHYPGLIALRDEAGNELQFPSAFRQQRHTGYRKGIVTIVK
jgi:hypothetical protein